MAKREWYYFYADRKYIGKSHTTVSEIREHFPNCCIRSDRMVVVYPTVKRVTKGVI